MINEGRQIESSHFMNRFFSNIALLLLLISPAAAESKTVRLLTVGNSFSHNAVHYLGDLAKADGHVLVLRECIIGGGSLQQHWEKAQKHEADPKDPDGFYKSKTNLRDELKADPWDVITLQQYSFISHDVNTYRPHARQLHDYIKKLAPTAEVVIHQTWEYRVDDARFSPTYKSKPGEPRTQQEMYAGLKSAYAAIAGELHIRIIPTGDAFHLADADPAWGFQKGEPFHSKTAKYPSLPVQSHSLHVGWRWKKNDMGEFKPGMDGHHANMAGEYLGGCVWYQTLFGKSPVGNAFIPKGLDPAYARFLQETAHRAAGKSN